MGFSGRNWVVRKGKGDQMRLPATRLHAMTRLRTIPLFAVLLLALAGLMPLVNAPRAHADLTPYAFIGIPGNPLNFDKNPLDVAYAIDPVCAGDPFCTDPRQIYVATYGASGQTPGPSRLYTFGVEPGSMGFQWNAGIDLGDTRPTRTIFNQSTNQIFIPRQRAGDVAILTGTVGHFTDPVMDVEVFLGFSPSSPYGNAAPFWAELNKTTNKLYVPRTNPTMRDLVVIDGNDPHVPIDNLPKIPLDDSANGVAIDEATNRIFVARPTHKDIMVINGNDNSIIGYVQTWASPRGLAFNPINGKLYAANGIVSGEINENSVTVVDMNIYATMYHIRAGIGLDPQNVEVNPTTNRVYVTSRENRELAVVNSVTDGVIRVARTLPFPMGLDVDPVNNIIFTGAQGFQPMLAPGDPGTIELWSDPPSSPPTPTHYFPEGTTRPGFQSYLTVFAPDINTTVTVTYELGPGQGGPIVKTYGLAGGSRATIDINADVGANKDVSTRIVSDSGRPIFAERVMYFNGVVVSSTDGTASPGFPNFWQNQSAPRDFYFFTEGTTRPGFSEYLTLVSPGTSQTVDITYYFGAGQGAPKVVSGVSLPAGERVTIHVNDPSQAGTGKDVSAKVVSTSSTPFYAERPMYFDASTIGVAGGHNGMGLPMNPFTDTVFPEGTTRPGFRTFLTLFSDTDQRLKSTYYQAAAGEGETQKQNVVGEIFLPANERVTVELGSVLGGDSDVGTRLTSCGNVPDCTPADPSKPYEYAGALPFYAERPMYFSGVSIGSAAAGGTVNTPITTLSYWPSSMQSEYYLAEGTNRILTQDWDITGGFQTYLTLLSPDMTQTVQVMLYLGPGETPVKIDQFLPKARRVTVDVNFYATFIAGNNKDFAIHVVSPTNDAFYLERPMFFWNVMGGIRGGTLSTGFHN